MDSVRVATATMVMMQTRHVAVTVPIPTSIRSAIKRARRCPRLVRTVSDQRLAELTAEQQTTDRSNMTRKLEA